MVIRKRELILIAFPTLLVIPIASIGGILAGHAVLWLYSSLKTPISFIVAAYALNGAFITILIFSAISNILAYLPGLVISSFTVQKFGRYQSDPPVPSCFMMVFLVIGLFGLLVFFFFFCATTGPRGEWWEFLSGPIIPVLVSIKQAFNAIGVPDGFFYSDHYGAFSGSWGPYIGYLVSASIPWFWGSIYASFSLELRRDG